MFWMWKSLEVKSKKFSICQQESLQFENNKKVYLVAFLKTLKMSRRNLNERSFNVFASIQLLMGKYRDKACNDDLRLARYV